MTEDVPVLKDEENQQLVPAAWRGPLSAIVEAFTRGDFEIKQGVVGMLPIPRDLAIRMSQNVEAYGASTRLSSLPAEAWETSVCQWTQGHWDVLVDLFDEIVGAIDLVLHVRVSEDEDGYTYQVRSLHVP